MQCPNCKSEGAYVGFREVKCPAYACRFYDEEQLLLSQKAEQSKKNAAILDSLLRDLDRITQPM